SAMSGHSKWATIKHKNGAADKARGKLFAKLIRQLEVSAREVGGDIDVNPTLRTMYEKTRSSSVPMYTTPRAIKRGTRDPEGLPDQGDTWQLTSAPQALHALQTALEEAGIAYDSADLTMLPTSEVPLESEGDARKVLKLIDALEEHDDVQNVYSNFDIPDSVLQAVEA